MADQYQGIDAEQYRKMIIENFPQTIGLLQMQLQILAALTQQIDPTNPEAIAEARESAIQQAQTILSMSTLEHLLQVAQMVEEQQNKTDLVVAKNPGLVDQEGRPLANRQARRNFDRELNKLG